MRRGLGCLALPFAHCSTKPYALPTVKGGANPRFPPRLAPQERHLLKSVPWAAACFDEAHRLKGLQSSTRQAVKALDVPWLLLLTGRTGEALQRHGMLRGVNAGWVGVVVCVQGWPCPKLDSHSVALVLDGKPASAATAAAGDSIPTT